MDISFPPPAAVQGQDPDCPHPIHGSRDLRFQGQRVGTVDQGILDAPEQGTDGDEHLNRSGRRPESPMVLQGKAAGGPREGEGARSQGCGRDSPLWQCRRREQQRQTARLWGDVERKVRGRPPRCHPQVPPWDTPLSRQDGGIAGLEEETKGETTQGPSPQHCPPATLTGQCSPEPQRLSNSKLDLIA